MYIVKLIIFVIGYHISESMREPRSAADPRKNCGTWSTWVNKHTPTNVDNREREYMTPQELANFCPVTYAGTITKFECSTADINSEAFQGNQTYSDFFIGCYDYHVGVTCTITNVNTIDHCPDLKIRYFCTCSSLVPITQPSTANSGTSVKQGVTNDTPQTNNTPNNSMAKNEQNVNLFGLSVASWVFILVLSLFLFLLNTLVTVCLYKKATKKVRKQKKIKVHPLEKV